MSQIASVETSRKEQDLESGLRVLTQEAEALLLLRDHLGDEFTKAVEVIANVKGRLVVTGMGKSGHVARKIAATMASTGTPAFFLHPGEASHGDLGMIKRGEDAVLALSFSGSTKELNDIVEYSKRFSVPLIGMTGGNDSTLNLRSDVCLTLPAITEACPNNQAPTTSTTLMMALGDALAVALLERQNLTADQFKVFHPGGKLGQKLLRVSDILQPVDQVPSAVENTPMTDILETITQGKQGCVCIMDGDHLMGIITDGDIRRHANKDINGLTASDVMTKDPKTLPSTALGAEAIGLLNEKQITSLPIVDDGKLIGLVHIHDCLRAAIA